MSAPRTRPDGRRPQAAGCERARGLAVIVEPDTLIARHLLGRSRDGRPTRMFSASWTVQRQGDKGELLSFLLSREDDAPDLMCDFCGSFDVDRVEIDDPWHCRECNRMRVVVSKGPEAGS